MGESDAGAYRGLLTPTLGMFKPTGLVPKGHCLLASTSITTRPQTVGTHAGAVPAGPCAAPHPPAGGHARGAALGPGGPRRHDCALVGAGVRGVGPCLVGRCRGGCDGWGREQWRPIGWAWLACLLNQLAGLATLSLDLEAILPCCLNLNSCLPHNLATPLHSRQDLLAVLHHRRAVGRCCHLPALLVGNPLLLAIVFPLVALLLDLPSVA